MSLFDKTTQGLAASLQLRLLRNKVTSSNIANAETPGYKAQKVEFESALSRALDTDGMGRMHAGDPDHFLVGSGSIKNVRADVYDNSDTQITNSGNTVDLEQEMASLANNTVLYKAALELINKKLGALRYAVTEGSR